MPRLLTLALILLGGCTNTPQADISGIWINQGLIDAAALGQQLNTQSANLEWNIDTHAGTAQVSSGFETGEGKLLQTAPDSWTVDYDGRGTDRLRLEGKQLIQLANRHVPQQTFSRPPPPVITGEGWSNTFRRALNSAYMAGKWRIIDGQGTGIVEFTAEGRVSGLPNVDRYELCLGGDCASQGAGNDTLWLGTGDVSDTWIFVRKGKQLEIFQAINQSPPMEIPTFKAGPRRWLLEKQ